MSALVMPVPASPIADVAARRAMLSVDYLPPCPACSLWSLPPRAPQFWGARHTGGVMLSHCCELSKGSPIVCQPQIPESGVLSPDARRELLARQLAARVVVANWWKMKRLMSERDVDARTERQRELLALFRERGLTPEMEATR